MRRSDGGANSRSKNPAMPDAPSQRVSMRTRVWSPSGVTVQVVMRLEVVSDSVMTRPGTGSSTRIR